MENEFFIHVDDTPKRLFVSRPKVNKSGAFQPCDMSPDDVDFEMSTGKNPEILEIHGMNQESFEHFVTHYGQTYRYLHFFHCQLIKDFSPLEDLKKLERVWIDWNIRADKLWDMSRNESLNHIRIIGCKKMTLNLELLSTSDTLEEVGVCGSIFNDFPIESMDIFGRLPKLRALDLYGIRPKDKRLDFLRSAANLEEFNFDAGMLTTEDIAWIVAKYPHLTGTCLGPYEGSLNSAEVRVCGYRKPSLYLPEQANRLEKYIANFNALVEKFRNEP